MNPFEERYKQLLQLILACRSAQKAYYAAPGNPRDNMTKAALLGQAKAAEKELDAMLWPKNDKQIDLFG